MSTKQQEAPGELEHVRAFVNTLDVEKRADELAGSSELADWFSQHDLAPAGTVVDDADLAHAIALREALRKVLLAHNTTESIDSDAASELDRAAARARLRLRFDDQGSSCLESEAQGVDAALGRLLAIVHRSAADGTWVRLKACRDDACQWAFYDHTKNRSGAWCTMEVCGNRAKARAYRERRGAPRGVQG